MTGAEMGLLPENADERRMFDSFAETLGGPLRSIANSLYVQRGIISIPGASFYEQSTIQFNELIKAESEHASLTSSLEQRDRRIRELEAQRIDDLVEFGLMETRAKAAETRVEELTKALRTAIKVANEARQEWDKAPDGMRAGKLLIALSDPSLNYRADITAMHRAVLQPRGER